MPIHIRVGRQASGRLRVMDGVREVWSEGRNLLPERRVLLLLPLYVADHAERLVVDIDQIVRR
jgi:hypothetical protein